MNKRYKEQYEDFIYKGEGIPFSLGTLCTVMLGLLLLIVGTFTQLHISHPWLGLNEDGLHLVIREFNYIPQVPFVLFVSAVLGARFGLLTVILYLAMGFFCWPVFSFGGGLSYIKSPVFGYILGYFPAVILSGAILHKDSSYKGLALSSLFGVLIIHTCGIIYLGFLSIFGFENFPFVIKSIISVGGAKIIYDIFFSFILMSLAYPVKCVLWLAMKNSPAKPKS